MFKWKDDFSVNIKTILVNIGTIKIGDLYNIIIKDGIDRYDEIMKVIHEETMLFIILVMKKINGGKWIS